MTSKTILIGDQGTERSTASPQALGLVNNMGLRIWMGGELQGDIGVDYQVARNEIEQSIQAAVGQSTYGIIKEWAVIAIILEEDIPGYQEVKRFKKTLQKFEFRLKIGHATFKTADDLGKRKLITAALLRSIDEMRKLVPKGIDYAQLESDVRGVAASKGWL